MVKISKKAALGKAGKAVQKPYGKKVAQNKKFRTVHKVSYSGGTKAARHTQSVREIDQVPFEEVLTMNQRQARNFLIRQGVIAEKRTPVRLKIACWNCGVVMKVQSDNSLRCQHEKCKARSRVCLPHFAFSPFYTQASAGWQVNYSGFLRTAYCLGIKSANDQGAHLARQDGQSYRAARDMVSMFYKKHRVVLAYAEKTHAQQEIFHDDVVEIDTGRTSGKTVGRSRHHQGRLLAVKGRLKKTWAVHGLATKVSDGKRGSPPETKAEMTPLLQRTLGKGVIVAPDGAPAWTAATAGHARLKGVSHLNKVFTPASKLNKRDVDSRTKKLLDRNSQGPKRLAAEYKSHWRLAGGDNAAESLLGHVKNAGRRMQTVGRTGSETLKEVQSLAAARMLRCPGLQTILDAYRNYREAGLKGRLQVAPSECFLPEKCSWLTNHACGSTG